MYPMYFSFIYSTLSSIICYFYNFSPYLFVLHYIFKIGNVENGDFVYFDPPYIPLSKTANFSSYTKDGFGKAQHESLKDLMLLLSEKGANVLLSNSDCDSTMEIYGDLEKNGFTFQKISVQRTISGKSKGRTTVSELIIGKIC